MPTGHADDERQAEKQVTDNPYFVEQELRGHFGGIRLVGELDLAPDGPLYGRARSVVRKVLQHGTPERLRRYPACIAVFLAAEGALRYDDGAFWPNVDVLADLTPGQQTAVGQSFRSALEELDLETFNYVAASEGWLTNLGPILMHGGIPETCADSVAQLVLKGMNEGVWDASELISQVRRSRSRWAALAKPVQRFLEHGGEFAVDLLQRMIDTVADAAELGRDIAASAVNELAEDAGLPRYLAQVLVQDGRSIGARSRRPPLPYVRIDRYSSDGPYMTLPTASGGGEWLIQGVTTRSFPASPHDSREVPLAPSHGWSATLTRRHGATRLTSVKHFGGLEQIHAYLFDGTGRLMPHQRRLATEGALILMAPGVAVTEEDGSSIAVREELPARTGMWNGWTLANLDLANISAVIVKPGPGSPEHPVRLTVSRSAATSTVAGAHVVGATGPNGSLVFPAPPVVSLPEGADPAQWRVRWRDDRPEPMPSESADSLSSRTTRRAPRTIRAGQLPRTALGYDLSALLPESAAYSGTLETSGPLGSDGHDRITVVRSLRVEMPNRVFGPHEDVEIGISADCELRFADGSALDASHHVFEAGQDSLPFLVEDVKCSISIPRLAWDVQRNDGSFPTLGGKRLKIGLDEIESDVLGSLLVRCGRPSMLRLELRGDTRLQEAGPERAGGPEGRWSFPLNSFRATVAASTIPRMSLVLHVDDLAIQVAEIEAQLEINGLHIDTIRDSATNEVLVSATWKENRPFAGRELRLWSMHRPWDLPIRIDVAAEAVGRCEAIIRAHPGPYFVEVVLSDEWSNPVRPDPKCDGIVHHHIGTDLDRTRHLEGLHVENPVEALELLMSGFARRRRLDTSAAARATNEVIEAFDFVSQLDELETISELAHFVLASGPLVDDVATGLIDLPPQQRLSVQLAVVAAATRPAVRSVPQLDLDRLWKTAPLMAAALDAPFDASPNGDTTEVSRERWEKFAGWLPRPRSLPVEERIEPVSPPLDERNPDELQLLQLNLPPWDSLPLEFGGYREAAFEMLSRTWPESPSGTSHRSGASRNEIRGWRSKYHSVHSYTQRLSDLQLAQLEKLKPDDGRPGWHSFPKDLVIAAFGFTDRTTSRANHALAQRALLDAFEIAPLLTLRSILIALAIKHIEFPGGILNDA